MLRNNLSKLVLFAIAIVHVFCVSGRMEGTQSGLGTTAPAAHWLVSDRGLSEGSSLSARRALEGEDGAEEGLEKIRMFRSARTKRNFKTKSVLKKLSGPEVKKRGLERFNKFHQRLDYVMTQMPDSGEVQKRFEVTFANICDSDRMAGLSSSMSQYITDVFEKSQLKMATTNEVLKKDLLRHYKSILNYSAVLNKYTEKVITSFVVVYFGVRMQTILAYIASILNQVYVVDLPKNPGSPEVAAFQKSLTTYMFKEETLGNDVATMSSLVLALRSEALKAKYYDVTFKLGSIKASEEDIKLRREKDGRIVKDTCSAVLSILSVYLNNNQAVAKAMNTIFDQVAHSHSYFTQFLDLYSPFVVSGYDDVGQLADLNRKQGTEPTVPVILDCTELKGAKVYKDIFSFISFNKLGVDLNEPATLFKAKEFFFKGYFTQIVKEVPAEAKELVQWDLFLLHGESSQILDLTERYRHFGLTSLSFHHQFLSDFSVVLFYDFADIKPLSYRQAGIFSFKLRPNKPTKPQQDGLIQASDFLTLLDILYKGYLSLRLDKSHQLSKFDKTTMNAVKSTDVYRDLMALFTSEQGVDSLVSRGYLSTGDLVRYYLQVVNYLCAKLGAECKIADPSPGMEKVIIKYRVTRYDIVKVTITETILKIYTRVKKDEMVQKMKDALAKIRFVVVPEDCRGLPAKVPACAPVIEVYKSFMGYIKEVFKLPDNDMVSLVMEFTFEYVQEDLGKDSTQEVVYLYFFHFFLMCRGSGECPMTVPEFDGLKFWPKFLERVKGYFVRQTQDKNMAGFLRGFLHVLVHDDQRYKLNADKPNHFIVQLTESQFQFIEELYFFFIFQEAEKDDKKKLPRLQTDIADNLKRLSRILGVADKNMYSSFNEFQAKMRLDETKVVRGDGKAAVPRDWKVRTSNGIFEAIMVYSRLTLFLSGAKFFQTFDVKNYQMFGQTENYPYQNPFTVLFNYFALLHELADKNKFYLQHVNGFLYKQVKGCMQHTSELDFKTTETCALSHRKYAELFYFVQFNYRQTSQNSLIPLAKYTDDNVPPVHVRIFVSSVIGYSTYFEAFENDCAENSTIFCLILKLTAIVRDHVISTDRNQFTPEQFENKLFSALPDTVTDKDVMRVKFAMLGASEVVSYMSLASQTTDRFVSFADFSKQVDHKSKSPEIQEDLKRLAVLQAKGLFSLKTESEKKELSFYLFRSFYKPVKNNGEKKGLLAVNLELQNDMAKLTAFFSIGSAVYLDYLKVFLVFSPPSGYDKLAQLIISQDVFLQIPKMNMHTFDEELKSLVAFLNCDQLENLDFKNKLFHKKCPQAPAPATKEKAPLYLKKVYLFFSKNSFDVLKNDLKQDDDESKDNDLVNPNVDMLKNGVRIRIEDYLLKKKTDTRPETDKIKAEISKMSTTKEAQVEDSTTVVTKEFDVDISRPSFTSNFELSKRLEFQEMKRVEADEIAKELLKYETAMDKSLTSTIKDQNLSSRFSATKTSNYSPQNDIQLEERRMNERSSQVLEQRSYASITLRKSSVSRVQTSSVFSQNVQSPKRISV